MYLGRLRDLGYRFKGNEDTDAAEDYPTDKSSLCFFIDLYANPGDC